MIDTGEGDLSVFNSSFWDLWLQKNLRNLASVKYQWLLYLYLPVIYGMFNEGLTKGQPWITPTLGLSFLGGGFVTLALGRLMANTKLKTEKDSTYLNVHSQNIQRGQPPDHNIVMGDNIDIKPDPYYASNILDTEK